MIRARDSHDDWGRYACHVLDRVRRGGFSMPSHIDWALAYLGDKPGSTKIPADLLGRKPATLFPLKDTHGTTV